MSFQKFVEDLQSKLGIPQNRVHEPIDYLKQNFPPSYYYEPLEDEPYASQNPRNKEEQLKDKALLEMVHSRHGSEEGGSIFVDQEKEEVIRLNLCSQALSPESLREVLKSTSPYLNLKALSLAESSISSFTFYESCQNLSHLELSRNEKLKQIRFDVYPQGLKTLDAYACRIEEVIIDRELPKLERLDLARNKALKLVGIKASCPALRILDLSDNALQELILEHNFAGLKDLYLHDNPLERLVLKEPGAFRSLRKLHLRNTKLKALPEGMLDFPAMENLYLHGVPLEDITVESLPSGESEDAWETVKTLLEANKGEELFALNEAKMILIGNPFSGKTCLRRKLIDINAPLTEVDERTPGLEVEPYFVRLEAKGEEEAFEFKLNIWDFGGQGKYREVQQLFCSRKALYIYVEAVKGDDEARELELEEYYVDYAYWVNMAQAYSFDATEKKASPVLYVLNKIDIREEFLNQKTIYERFPQVAGYAPISLKKIHDFKQEFDALQDKIKGVIPKISSDIFKKNYNRSWLGVKDELENLRKEGVNYIGKAKYKEICERHKLKEKEAEIWLNTLHNIGTVIYFGKDEDLEDWVFMNPLWFRDAMYKVIENEREVRKGKFQEIDFERIWDHALVYNRKTGNEERIPYGEEERKKFIALMKAYNLCYEKADEYGDVAYYVPSLFAKKLPEEIPPFWGKPVAKFELHYDPFVPAGMVNKLMVLTEGNKARFADWMVGEEDIRERVIHRKAHFVLEGGLENFVIYGAYRCRNEFVLQDQVRGVYAHVKEDWKNQKVTIDMYTPSDSKNYKAIYHYLTSVLDQVLNKLINSHYMRALKVEEFKWIGEDLEPLEKLRRKGEDIFGEGQHKKENKSLLQGVQERIMKDELREALDFIKDELKDTPGELVNFYRELTEIEKIEGWGNEDRTKRNTITADWTKRVLDYAKRMSGKTPPGA